MPPGPGTTTSNDGATCSVTVLGAVVAGPAAGAPSTEPQPAVAAMIAAAPAARHLRRVDSYFHGNLPRRPGPRQARPL